MKFKVDIPPKGGSNIVGENEISFVSHHTVESLENDLGIYEKKDYISPTNFKKLFDMLLKNNELFYLFYNRIETLLQLSMDESFVVDENNDYTDRAESKIVDALEKKVGPYLDYVFSVYKDTNFSEKIKILYFLQHFYAVGIFYNNSYSKRKIEGFFSEIMETEKKDMGNYYIFLHLDKLVKGTESSSYTQISPNRFVTEKFVYDEEGFHRTKDNIFDWGSKHGSDKLFISNEKDFEKIKETIERMETIKNKKKTEDFLLRDSIKKNELFECISECDSYFTVPLDESYFRPYVKKEEKKDNFFDHKFFQYKSIRDEFKNKAGFTLEETSLPEQYNFFEYTKEITNKEAGHFFQFLNSYGKDAFRTFLSIEQGGKEMGDKIIELSTLLNEDATKIIFEGYSNILNEADKLKNRMSALEEAPGVNQELVKKIPLQIHDALLLRTKDILLGAHLLAKNNELNGLRIVNVREAMDGISLMLRILNDIGQENNFSFQEKNRTEQNFKYEITNKENQKKYGLKIFLRPKAEKNAQARVNIELSFDTDNPDERLKKAFYNKVESHTQNKITEGSVLRIAIDREERNGGQVSLDIGRSLHSDTELSRTGDTLGNLLAIASKEGHHTTESFDPRFAEEETFSQIVKLFENYLVSQKSV